MRLVVDGVSVVYRKDEIGETVGLPGSSFIFESGCPVVLMGGNGSGKTTLLRVLAGELEPTSGTLGLENGGRQRRVGHKWLSANSLFLRQDPLDGGFGEFTLSENLKLLCARGTGLWSPYLRTEAFKQIEDEVAEREPLYLNSRNQRLADLSRGQRQRFLLTVCRLRTDKTIVLLDEPFAAIDEASVRRMEESLRTWLVQPNIISVIVSHSAEIASKLQFEVVSID